MTLTVTLLLGSDSPESAHVCASETAAFGNKKPPQVPPLGAPLVSPLVSVETTVTPNQCRFIEARSRERASTASILPDEPSLAAPEDTTASTDAPMIVVSFENQGLGAGGILLSDGVRRQDIGSRIISGENG